LFAGCLGLRGPDIPFVETELVLILESIPELFFVKIGTAGGAGKTGVGFLSSISAKHLSDEFNRIFCGVANECLGDMFVCRQS